MAQESIDIRIPLTGETAPSFKAESTIGPINFPKDYYGKWKILFSHPADFTPVCSTELLELANDQESFKELNTQIVVMSTDSKNSHIEWISSLEDLTYKGREIEEIDFPVVADDNLNISKKYGMIHPNTSSTKDVRGVFVIDPSGKIRAIFYYPMEVGRNMDEIKRTVIALQTVASKGILTPANWEPGDDVLIKVRPENEGQPADKDVYQVIWYMTFKKLR